MDYKKKYEDALERARKINIGEEDERIKNEIIGYLKSFIPHHDNDLVAKSKVWIAWLEKQGEQTSTDKVEPKFKVGDWVVPNNGEPRVFRVEERGWPDSIISDSLGNQSVNTFTLDKQYRLWTIQDAKDGDVLAYPDNTLVLFKTLCKGEDEGVFMAHVLFVNNRIEEKNSCSVGGTHPATKERRALLFSKMKEAGYEWDDEKKELKKIESVQHELPNGEDYGIDSLYHAERILEKTLGEVDGYQSDDGILEHKCAIEAVKRLYEQKPTWSEDDNKLIDSVIELIDDGALDRDEKDYFIENLKSLKNRALPKQEWSEDDEKMINSIIKNLDEGEWFDIYQADWLKSLKERYTWKPSEEQMKQLGWIAKQNKDNMIGKELMSLYQDLKKLRTK